MGGPSTRAGRTRWSQVDVDDDVGQIRDVVEELVMGDLGDLVRSGDGQCAIDAESNLGEQAVSHPARSDLGHRLFDAGDDGRVNGIEQSLATLERSRQAGGRHRTMTIPYTMSTRQ